MTADGLAGVLQETVTTQETGPVQDHLLIINRSSL
jgi:hypothetical protein